MNTSPMVLLLTWMNFNFVQKGKSILMNEIKLPIHKLQRCNWTVVVWKWISIFIPLLLGM